MTKIATIIAVLAVISPACFPPAYAAKKPALVISATIRTNKFGQKVDLSKAPLYKDAVADFNGKKYGPALEKFTQLDQSGFCCDMIHYYLAQCYDYLNQVEQAQINYSWVVAYTQDPSLRTYATYGYQKLAYYNAHRGATAMAGGVPKPPTKGFG
jgi:hypothetical protein